MFKLELNNIKYFSSWAWGGKGGSALPPNMQGRKYDFAIL